MVRYIIFGGLGGLVGIVLFGLMRESVGSGPMLLISLAVIAVVLVIALNNLSSNRKVANASAEERARALAFTADEGRAALYMLRTQFVGMAVGINIAVDGREVAQLKSPRFTRIALAPGAHTLGAYYGTADKPKGKGELALNVAAGDVVVVRAMLEPQAIGSIVKLARVELAQARADLAKTRMVVAEVGEV